MWLAFSSSLTLFRLSIVALRVRISLLLISTCCLRSCTSLAWASRFAAYCASSLFYIKFSLQRFISFGVRGMVTLSSAMDSAISTLLTSSS